MQTGERIANRFEIIALGGSGGMSSVFRALDHQTGATVAVKVLQARDPRDGERFEREAKVLASLDHPNIVRYIAHGVSSAGEAYLAMEWLEGEDLAQRLWRSGLSTADSLAIALRVAEALGVAHARGVVHRDIKPSNLLLPDGDVTRVKVVDFGIARVANATRGMTRTGVMVGTPGYMAPEQVRGLRHLDARVDVFALGCVLFECLAGRAAFESDALMAMFAKILVDEPPRLSETRPDLPAALDALVARMMAKNPEGRPNDGRSVAQEIAALGHIEGGAPGASVEVALTEGERRLLCVILAGSGGTGTMASITEIAFSADATFPDDDDLAAAAEPDANADAPGASSVSEETSDATLQAVRTEITLHGARLDRLADGSLVITLAGDGAATDQVARAARCALAIRTHLPGVPIALATGRAEIGSRAAMGDAIDRAVKLLEIARAAGTPRAGGDRPIRIDEVTAGLLDDGFIVGEDSRGLELRERRETAGAARTLMGRPTPCVGRERELSVLEGFFDECVAEGLARVVLVTAPAGVGKSRVRYEFLQRIRARNADVEIWEGRGDPIGAGSPFGIVGPALRRTAGITANDSIDAARLKLRTRVVRHLPAADVARVSELMGEIAGVPFPDSESVQLRAARRDAVLMNDQMRRAWEDLLTAECAVHPVLLVLEDMQWGDLPTVKLIDGVLSNLRERPFMVLALARPEVHALFPRLWNGRAMTELPIGDLSRKGSERLVRFVLGERASADIVARVVERAGGNAFYLEELIRAVAEGNESELPETVLAMAQARVESMTDEARLVLRAASVFGKVFWKAGVIALLGGGQRSATLDQCFADMVEREVIIRIGEGKVPGDEEYLFRHSLLREAAYAMLTESDRTLGHRLAGDWLDRVGAREAVMLAEHFERGGEAARAVNWYRLAAEQALDGNDLTASIARAERGIQCGAAGVDRGLLRAIQTEAHLWCAQYQDLVRTAPEALEWLPSGGVRWCTVAGQLALAHGQLGQSDAVEAMAKLLASVEPEPDAQGAWIVAMVRATRRILYGLHPERAEEFLVRIDAAVETIGALDPVAESVVCQARASKAHLAGDSAVFGQWLARAAELLESAGDTRNACMQRGNAAYASMKLGRFADAERALRDSLAQGGRLALTPVIATAKHNLGLVLAIRGEFKEAIECETAAIAMFIGQNDRRLTAGARCYLARILVMAGEYEAALREAREAVEVASDGWLKGFAEGVLASALLGSGAVSEAIAAGAAAMKTLSEAPVVEEADTYVRLVYAEALRAAGDLNGSRETIQRARAEVMARAAVISDPDAQRDFLQNIPEHARTIALAAEWG